MGILADAPARTGDLELRFLFLAWLGLALVVGSVLLAVWIFGRKTGTTFWPRQRQRLVTWSFVEVGLAYVIYLLCPSLLAQFFLPTSYQLTEQALSSLHGKEVPDAVLGKLAELKNRSFATKEAFHEALAEQLPPDELNRFRAEITKQAYRQMTRAERTKLTAWISLAALLLQVGGILFFLYWHSGARPYQVGLSAHRLRENLALGYGAWLVLTPTVYLVYWLYLVVSGESGGVHTLQEFFQQQPGIASWVLILLSAMVAAPFIEELLFRGVIQPWMMRAPLDQLLFLFGLILALSAATPAFTRTDALRLGIFVGVAGLAFAAFAALMKRRLPQLETARGIYFTSLLFAAIHFSIWPSPVPLLFLSLGLGYLAYRTQSLVAPVLVHSLFNGVSVVALLIQAYETNPHFGPG